MNNLIIYDTEIRHGVATPDNPPQNGYRYAKGWTDFEAARRWAALVDRCEPAGLLGTGRHFPADLLPGRLHETIEKLFKRRAI